MLRYARHARDMWSSEINEAVVRRVAPVAGETVVDIGSGVGAGTMLAASLGAAVMAVEPTPYMRRILGWRRLASRHRDRVRITNGAAEATGLASGAADAIWAVNTMHHWVDVDAAVTEISRVLKPGGRLLLVDEDFDDPAHPDHEKFAARHEGGHGHHFDMVDPQTMADQFTALGVVVTHAGPQTLAGRPTLFLEAAKFLEASPSPETRFG